MNLLHPVMAQALKPWAPPDSVVITEDDLLAADVACVDERPAA